MTSSFHVKRFGAFALGRLGTTKRGEEPDLSYVKPRRLLPSLPPPAQKRCGSRKPRGLRCQEQPGFPFRRRQLLSRAVFCSQKATVSSLLGKNRLQRHSVHKQRAARRRHKVFLPSSAEQITWVGEVNQFSKPDFICRASKFP